jgi:hypothetical protein
MTIQLADYACVPVAGAIGRGIELAQWLNGDGFAAFEHALIYAGHFDSTPHADPRWVEGSGPGHYVVEAQTAGARLRCLDFAPQDYPGARWSTGHVALTDAQRGAIADAAFALLGTPYSFLDYAALSAHRLELHPLDYALKGRVASSKHLICSQLVDLCYEKAGVHLFNDKRWPGYVTPLDLAKLAA